jgi:hypothetical protein
VVDAEGQYDGRYYAAQQYVRALRAALGASFPIALAGQAEVLEHPEFPYSVFLGPGAFGFDMPQMYWLELGLSVDAAYAAAVPENAIYGRPIVPVGQLAGAPAPSELERFRAGADGDEIVWAQELLNATGARLPVGGFFGAQTAHALAAFQARHRLPASGVLGPATWRALLRLRPREPSWAEGPPDSARR